MTQNSRARCGIRVECGDGGAKSMVACTDQVRIEFLRRRVDGPVRWAKKEHEACLFYLRSTTGRARMRMAGRRADCVLAGKVSLCFFPPGVGAEGELEGGSLCDYAGVFVGPSILPDRMRRLLPEPLIGFRDDALGRAFDELFRELSNQDDIFPLFTRAWVMQALAYVARAARALRPGGPASSAGLAPWQLRRAENMLHAHLGGEVPVARLAAECRLSVSQFARGFKKSTGVPPHHRLLSLRVEAAQEYLANSDISLAEIAGLCGFSDQSHFTKIFTRHAGISPGAWRRERGDRALARAARPALPPRTRTGDPTSTRRWCP